MDHDTLYGKIYSAIYADGSFEKITLGHILNQGGAAGKIYENQNNANTVAKIYHDKNKSSTNRQKLEAMLHNIPILPKNEMNGKEYIQLAWPTAILEDEEGFCVGYLMPKIDTSQAVSFDHLIQKAIREKLKLPEKYSYRVLAAYNLSVIVGAMHKCGHYIIDLKPSNLFVYKSTFSVVMFDCDGFSILGEYGRYPAEYVSEEYIYPEGKNKSCAEMDEEQDKFALAVTIFKLLNNGIHPFSGVPKKQDENMLSVQDRIFDNHYAYGFWPDDYQFPHPYSIHDFFDKKTTDMFERAFCKGNKRPSAKEWQEHLAYLLKNLKQCKKNPNHAFFTSKGCGMCIAEEKFSEKIKKARENINNANIVRGIDISSIDIEKNNLEKEIQNKKISNLRKIYLFFIAVYFMFFGSFYYIINLFKEQITGIGKGAQLIFIILLMLFINKTIKNCLVKSRYNDDYGIKPMMLIFAFCCMLITFFAINDFPENFWNLKL